MEWGKDIFDCDWKNESGNRCGVYIGYKPGRCKLHFGKESKKKREKIGKWSGYSKFRQDAGQFQGRKVA